MSEPLSPADVAIVKSTFAKVRAISDTAAKLFYQRLFETAPEVKPLFKGDMAGQGKMLMSMIGTAVNGLDRPETILPAVQDLGRRHVGYGVKEEHYAPVGAALLWTLGQGLGEAFTADAEKAWTKTYSLLADVMISAARGG